MANDLVIYLNPFEKRYYFYPVFGRTESEFYLSFDTLYEHYKITGHRHYNIKDSKGKLILENYEFKSSDIKEYKEYVKNKISHNLTLIDLLEKEKTRNENRS